MADEIGEAIQIIRLTYDGIEIGLKVGHGSFDLIKSGVKVLVDILNREKALGKTNMKKLLQKGGDLQVLRFSTEDMKQIKKMAKKYGVLYSVLPDINKADGLSEIIFHVEATPRMKTIASKFDYCDLTTYDEYLKNGKPEEIEKLDDFLVKKSLKNSDKDYDDFINRMKVISSSKNKDLVDVTISKNLINFEDEEKIKTRVPGTWGEEARYILLSKEDAMDIHEGKTILTFLDKEKDYDLYDERDYLVTTIKGEDLYSKHYDKVEKKYKTKDKVKDKAVKTIKEKVEIKKR